MFCMSFPVFLWKLSTVYPKTKFQEKIYFSTELLIPLKTILNHKRINLDCMQPSFVFLSDNRIRFILFYHR